MKIVIELDDSVLKKAVDAHVSKTIADMTADVIRARLETIIQTKYERFNFAEQARLSAEDLLRRHVVDALNSALGQSHFDRANTIRKIVAEEALKALKA